ncbi:hypothetical protein C7999DRAFT_11693 [Corynascus novoguineensis]|uniref:Synaptobrevin n=1 Tax=Corynascus novoguineensis TaxID=1126955 RepID=A0AAN7HHU9_9PEZI|nr:hypothetical protein C7999DRAFT_11693 [Corynascus novoguineensis]
MARLIPGVTATPTPRRADPLTDLTLLLSRLQRTILHADAEREARLRESEFEREKARANINYARSLLTKLEQETLAVKIHSRRQEVQADLVRKREVLEQLSERISDLAEFAAAGHPGHGEDEDTSDGEDILADIIATPSESIESTKSPDSALEEPTETLNQIPDSQEFPSSPPQPKEQKNTPPQSEQPPPSSSARLPSTTPPPTTTTAAAAAATTTTTSQALRFRQPEPPVPFSSTQETAAATGSSLFGDAKQRSSALTATPAAGAASTAEAILDHQRAEQDALSESILRLASELKASSHAFSASLEEDREVVTRAGKGLDQTGRQLEGVTRRMGALQRLTEGEGWWGRMRLYAIVYGLMVALVLVVFVLPKLRF